MWKKRVFVIVILVSVLPVQVWACACCADEGDWYQATEEFKDWEVEELNQVNFNHRAELFTAIYSPETKGLPRRLQNFYYFDLRPIRVKRDWALLLRGVPFGGNGVLRLKIPDKVEKFRTDLKDRPPSRGYPTVTLYKEMRFEGAISGEGIFKTKPGGKNRYKLILQGRGHICDSRDDYRNWVLIISGEELQFTLHGVIEQPKPAQQNKP
ncbi:MAG: hypothetical protein OEZ39_01750 [Gammaproteobacteria bacterium]|nr:hypothetical protein [Gammaproteobacteria bacterium]MDH5650577.1 hypothetical protein [Gammaproteobacteria bacterium]